MTMSVAQRVYLEDVQKSGTKADRRRKDMQNRFVFCDWGKTWRDLQTGELCRWPTRREHFTGLACTALLSVCVVALALGVCVALVKLGFGQ